jgi:hypothetical protein
MELELCLKRHTNEAAKAYVTELVGGGLREAFEPFTPPLTDNQDHSITKVRHTTIESISKREGGAEGCDVVCCVVCSRGVMRVAGPNTGTLSENDYTTGWHSLAS